MLDKNCSLYLDLEALTQVARMPEDERTRMGAAVRTLWQEKHALERILDQYSIL